ncbi:MAG: hypothetical protein P8103_11475 [Candidatus Thiodiazotropha sp.]|jgi:uncharacterized protein
MAIIRMLLLCLLSTGSLFGVAGEITYPPDKVVYDFSSPDPTALGSLLDRVGELQKLYANDPFEASIIIVVHETALTLFATEASRFQAELMQRAASLALGEIIQFRLCEMSARMQGLEADGFPDFTQLVSMADAEMVRLQQAGYAYLR